MSMRECYVLSTYNKIDMSSEVEVFLSGVIGETILIT